MNNSDDEYLWISELRQFVYCRRRWALIHIEQQWADNHLTVSGQIMHERCHDEEILERRGDLLVSRSMRVCSHRLGITGACDVVEFHQSDDGIALTGQEGRWNVVPVEYKHGNFETSDQYQLCAQAMCLEEMLVCDIPYGYLFYGKPRRRTKVDFSDELRGYVEKSLVEMRLLYKKGHTPKVKTSKACKSCSLADLCLPVLCGSVSAKKYINEHMDED